MGNDDVAVLNLDAPPIFHMQAEYPKAFVQLKTLSNSYDDTDDAAFDHNIETSDELTVGGSVRDVQSEEAFWVVQMFGAYEGPETLDFDPNEGSVLIGKAPGDDGPCYVFFEAIRDVRAYYLETVAEEVLASETTVAARIALHESLHRFGMYGHTEPVTNEGPMGEHEWEVGAAGDYHNSLTPRQIRRIIETLYPH